MDLWVKSLNSYSFISPPSVPPPPPPPSTTTVSKKKKQEEAIKQELLPIAIPKKIQLKEEEDNSLKLKRLPYWGNFDVIKINEKNEIVIEVKKVFVLLENGKIILYR